MGFPIKVPDGLKKYMPRKNDGSDAYKTAPEEDVPKTEEEKGKDMTEMLKQYRDNDDDDEVQEFVVDKNWFNMMIGVVIMTNTLVIGFEVDYGPQPAVDADGYDLPLAIKDRQMWYTFEAIFSVIFIVEALLKMYYYHWAYFKTWPNRFDFTLVVLSIVDTFMLQLMNQAGSLRKLTVLRVVKMARLCRLIRLLSMFKELWLVVSGVMQSLRTIMWVAVIILMIVYVIAIVMTMQVGHNPMFDLYFKKSGGWDHRMFFGSVPRSMLTMFQVVTLDQWCENIARHVITGSENKLFVLFFVVFIFCTSFGLLNLVVGIIVENTLAAARNNAEKIAQKQHEDRVRTLEALRDIFEIADADRSGTIELSEFEEVIKRREVKAKLLLIDIQAEEAIDLFQILDVAGCGVLGCEEFIAGCLKLKGAAKSKDLLAVQISVESMAKRMEHLNNCIQHEESLINKLDVLTSQMTRHYSSNLQDRSAGPHSVTTHRKLTPGTYMPNFPSFI